MHVVLTSLEFTITSFATPDEAREAQLKEAVSGAKVVDNMNLAPALVVQARNVVDGGTSAMNTMNTISATWVPLVDKIKLFTDLVDKASEVWLGWPSPGSSH
jgi:hypothetical protein